MGRVGQAKDFIGTAQLEEGAGDRNVPRSGRLLVALR